MSNKPKNINKKIISDEDDTDSIIYNLDEEINKKIIKKNYSIWSFDGEKKEEDIQLYFLNEFNFNPQNKFSN